VINTLDPDRYQYSAQNAGSGSVSNEYGSETLHFLNRHLDEDPYRRSVWIQQCENACTGTIRYLDVLNGRVYGTAQEGEESQVAKCSLNPRLRLSSAVAQGIHNPDTQNKI
jgi:hypothetical protein